MFYFFLVQNQRGNNQNRGGWVRNNNANNNNNVRGTNNNRSRGPAQVSFDFGQSWSIPIERVHIDKHSLISIAFALIQQQQGFRQNQGNNKPRTPKTTIKFEGDYDFEQANNKFEELRSTLAKLKVGEEVTKVEPVNGEADKKDDSGNETGAGEQEPEEEEVPVCYDKTKSFFDSISCEAASDRTKGKSRNDWRQERKINSETFGVSSARRGGWVIETIFIRLNSLFRSYLREHRVDVYAFCCYLQILQPQPWRSW